MLFRKRLLPISEARLRTQAQGRVPPAPLGSIERTCRPPRGKRRRPMPTPPRGGGDGIGTDDDGSGSNSNGEAGGGGSSTNSSEEDVVTGLRGIMRDSEHHPPPARRSPSPTMAAAQAAAAAAAQAAEPAAAAAAAAPAPAVAAAPCDATVARLKSLADSERRREARERQAREGAAEEEGAPAPRQPPPPPPQQKQYYQIWQGVVCAQLPNTATHHPPPTPLADAVVLTRDPSLLPPGAVPALEGVGSFVFAASLDRQAARHRLAAVRSPAASVVSGPGAGAAAASLRASGVRAYQKVHLRVTAAHAAFDVLRALLARSGGAEVVLEARLANGWNGLFLFGSGALQSGPPVPPGTDPLAQSVAVLEYIG